MVACKGIIHMSANQSWHPKAWPLGTWFEQQQQRKQCACPVLLRRTACCLNTSMLFLSCMILLCLQLHDSSLRDCTPGQSLQACICWAAPLKVVGKIANKTGRSDGFCQEMDQLSLAA